MCADGVAREGGIAGGESSPPEFAPGSQSNAVGVEESGTDFGVEEGRAIGVEKGVAVVADGGDDADVVVGPVADTAAVDDAESVASSDLAVGAASVADGTSVSAGASGVAEIPRDENAETDDGPSPSSSFLSRISRREGNLTVEVIASGAFAAGAAMLSSGACSGDGALDTRSVKRLPGCGGARSGSTRAGGDVSGASR